MCVSHKSYIFAFGFKYTSSTSSLFQIFCEYCFAYSFSDVVLNPKFPHQLEAYFNFSFGVNILKSFFNSSIQAHQWYNGF